MVADAPPDGPSHPVEPTWFEEADTFEDGVAAVRTAAGAGYIDTHGQWFVHAGTYLDVEAFAFGLGWVHDKAGYHVIDRAGHVSPIAFDNHGKFSGGKLAPVQTGTAWGLAGATGAAAVKPRFGANNSPVMFNSYEAIADAHAGFVKVKQQYADPARAWGYLALDGTPLIVR